MIENFIGMGDSLDLKEINKKMNYFIISENSSILQNFQQNITSKATLFPLHVYYSM